MVQPSDRLAPLRDLGVADHSAASFAEEWIVGTGPVLVSYDPTTGRPLHEMPTATSDDLEQVIAASQKAFVEWRSWPAPRRGELVRVLGDLLRENKEALGGLVSLEVGKIASEGLGEVQEMIDMADLAVGMSRQLFGKTMHSERPEHRMYEQWHPIGPTGIITAFNFPVAVWAWNAMVAAVCGNSMIWKPSPKAPLCSLAVTKLANEALRRLDAPPIFGLVIGEDQTVGEPLVADPRLPLISATGSVRMGRRVGQVVASRLGRSLLELGGNNAIVVLDDANLDLALRAILFAAVGTAGQRCTTCRRLFLQRGIADELESKLASAYPSIQAGDPLRDSTLLGPLIDQEAVSQFESAIATAKEQGGTVLAGGHAIEGDGYFVEPTLIRATPDMSITHEETFAPILYAIEFTDLDEAISLHNSVPQGLSSAVFTTNLLHAERFLSAAGSDCGIANVNIGTSGAEIGGAFGGEKETGGGREAGSDSWKAYMRRQTCTINYGTELPLAQGVEFDV